MGLKVYVFILATFNYLKIWPWRARYLMLQSYTFWKMENNNSILLVRARYNSLWLSKTSKYSRSNRSTSILVLFSFSNLSLDLIDRFRSFRNIFSPGLARIMNSPVFNFFFALFQAYSTFQCTIVNIFEQFPLGLWISDEMD